MLKDIKKISPSMLAAFEKCKLKFILDSNISGRKTYNNEFNPNSFLGKLIHKILETYYKESYDLELFDKKWEDTLIEYSNDLQFDSEVIDVLEYIKYWVPAYYPKKINTFKILKNHKLLSNGKVYSEKKVHYKNVYGIIDLYEVNENKIRITDFKTGILFNTEDGVNIGVKEAYVEQLKTYGYIIYHTEKIQAENIELVIKGLGNNEIYTFKCTHEEYVEQGLKIDNLINQTNKTLKKGNIKLLANPDIETCKFCDHIAKCSILHKSIKDDFELWDSMALISTIDVDFNIDELSINILINNKLLSIHKIPIKEFEKIKKINKTGETILLTKLYKVQNTRIRNWSRLSEYRVIKKEI